MLAIFLMLSFSVNHKKTLGAMIQCAGTLKTLEALALEVKKNMMLTFMSGNRVEFYWTSSLDLLCRTYIPECIINLFSCLLLLGLSSFILMMMSYVLHLIWPLWHILLVLYCI